MHSLRHFLEFSLRTPDTIRIIHNQAHNGVPCHGYHSHETWEIFAVLAGVLHFDCLGQEPMAFRQNTVVLVPPGCLHISIDRLPQDQQLRIMVFNLPGDENPYGMYSAGEMNVQDRFSLDTFRLRKWEELLGMAPRTLMELAARELVNGEWGEECALARLRLLFSSYADLVSHVSRSACSAAHMHVAKALNLLQSRYYERDLSVAAVAAAVGLSVSHLNRLFHRLTGKSPHEMLVEIRLRRAASLLSDKRYLIKEVAAMTGWGGQLYFSAAFRRHYGQSPSQYRR